MINAQETKKRKLMKSSSKVYLLVALMGMLWGIPAQGSDRDKNCDWSSKEECEAKSGFACNFGVDCSPANGINCGPCSSGWMPQREVPVPPKSAQVFPEGIWATKQECEKVHGNQKCISIDCAHEQNEGLCQNAPKQTIYKYVRLPQTDWISKEECEKDNGAGMCWASQCEIYADGACRKMGVANMMIWHSMLPAIRKEGSEVAPHASR